MSQAAAGCTLANERTVNPISASSTTQTASASGGLRIAKKAGVHSALAASCQPHKRSGRVAVECRHTRQAAKPIRA